MEAVPGVNKSDLRMWQPFREQAAWMQLTEYGSWSIVTGETGFTHSRTTRNQS